VLNGLSFTVNSGEKLALTGPSGSGKSTVVQLLLKLYRLGPRDSGEILINGVKI
jgi:ATP-binding cassette, subfamily B, bacterial